MFIKFEDGTHYYRVRVADIVAYDVYGPSQLIVYIRGFEAPLTLEYGTPANRDPVYQALDKRLRVIDP